MNQFLITLTTDYVDDYDSSILQRIVKERDNVFNQWSENHTLNDSKEPFLKNSKLKNVGIFLTNLLGKEK